MIWLDRVLARSTGIAKPRPMLPPDASPDELGTEAPAVGTPMSCAEQLTIAPPLLPGLMAASVCTADTSSADASPSLGTCTVRLSALTMPEVTVPDRPSGAPSTTTGWPTSSDSDEPMAIGFTPCSGATLITAMSVCGSRPTIVADSALPSENITWIEPPLAAAAITWSLVRMSPLELMTSPDPVPLPLGPFTAIVTTEGRTLSATGVTGHEATEESPAAVVPSDDEEEDDEEEAVAAPIRPAPTPTTANAAASPAHFGQRRRGLPEYRSPGPGSGLR